MNLYEVFYFSYCCLMMQNVLSSTSLYNSCKNAMDVGLVGQCDKERETTTPEKQKKAQVKPLSDTKAPFYGCEQWQKNMIIDSMNQAINNIDDIYQSVENHTKKSKLACIKKRLSNHTKIECTLKQSRDALADGDLGSLNNPIQRIRFYPDYFDDLYHYYLVFTVVHEAVHNCGSDHSDTYDIYDNSGQGRQGLPDYYADMVIKKCDPALHYPKSSLSCYL